MFDVVAEVANSEHTGLPAASEADASVAVRFTAGVTLTVHVFTMFPLGRCCRDGSTTDSNSIYRSNASARSRN